MYSLIGAHVNKVEGGIPETLGTWKGAVNVLLQPFPQLSWLQGSTKGRTVVRAFPDDSHNPDFNDPNLNPIDAARALCYTALAIIGDFPCTHIQLTNEPAISSRVAMKHMSDFDAECSRIMRNHGRSITLANLGTGNPPNMSWWEEYIPAIEQGMKDGAVLLVHAYTWPGVDDRWFLYRHRMIYEGCPEHNWAGLPKDKWINLVIGEIGFDKGTVEPGIYGGWRDLMNAQQYATWLQAVDTQLLRDPYVLGAAVFCLGLNDWKWSGYDIWVEPAQMIAANCTPLYRTSGKPAITNLVGRLPVKGRYPYRSVKRIKWVVAHHSGAGPKVVKNPIRHIENINRYCQYKFGWPGTPYTFAVDWQGTIYRCLRNSWVGYHCPGYNYPGYGILYIGTFDEEHPPTFAQLQSGSHLQRWLGKPCKEHREVINTACPGWNICP